MCFVSDRPTDEMAAKTFTKIKIIDVVSNMGTKPYRCDGYTLK